MRFGKKLDKFIWFMVYTLPFWAAAFTALANAGNNTGVQFANVAESFMSALPSGGLLYNTLHTIMLEFATENQFVTLMCGYISYLIIAHFAHICELVLVFFVHVAEDLIDKAGGKKE